MNSAGYIELIQRVGEISQEPQYKKDFYDLVLDVLEFKNWKQNDLINSLEVDRKTLYNHIYGICNSREETIHICVALGLDLVSTMIFLMSKGYILNINNHRDKKIMQFLNTNKTDGLFRMLDYYEFVK